MGTKTYVNVNTALGNANHRPRDGNEIILEGWVTMAQKIIMWTHSSVPGINVGRSHFGLAEKSNQDHRKSTPLRSDDRPVHNGSVGRIFKSDPIYPITIWSTLKGASSHS